MRLLLIKQISQIKEFSAFLCMEWCKSLNSLKWYLWYASQVSGASILSFLRAYCREGCCLMADRWDRWKVFFFFLPELPQGSPDHYPLLLLLSAKSHLTLFNPMDCSMPGSSVLHYLSEFSQTHVLWAGDASSPGESQESSPEPQFKSINFLVLRLLYGANLISIHDYWKNHSFGYVDLCWQSEVSAF